MARKRTTNYPKGLFDVHQPKSPPCDCVVPLRRIRICSAGGQPRAIFRGAIGSGTFCRPFESSRAFHGSRAFQRSRTFDGSRAFDSQAFERSRAFRDSRAFERSRTFDGRALTQPRRRERQGFGP